MSNPRLTPEKYSQSTRTSWSHRGAIGPAVKTMNCFLIHELITGKYTNIGQASVPGDEHRRRSTLLAYEHVERSLCIFHQHCLEGYSRDIVSQPASFGSRHRLKFRPLSRMGDLRNLGLPLMGRPLSMEPSMNLETPGQLVYQDVVIDNDIIVQIIRPPDLCRLL